MDKFIVKPFLFKDEIDILEIQLEELYDVVDYFIIVETERSFQGPIRSEFGQLEKHKDRFEKYFNKIIYYKIEKDSYPDDYETASSPQRRNFTYELLKEAVKNHNFPADTIILFGDCDEIPTRKVISRIRNGEIEIQDNTILNLGMDLYYFYFNYICDTIKWKGFKVLSLPLFLNNEVYTIRCTHDYMNIPTIENSGWHYSYFGDVDFVINKLNTTCDGTDLRKNAKIVDRNNIYESMKTGRDIYFRNEYSWTILSSAGLNLPIAVKNNPEKYSKYFHE